MGNSISETDARIFYHEICQSYPLSYPLTRVFQREIDSSTLIENGREGLFAKIKNPKLDSIVMSLYSANPGALLTIYSGDTGDVLKYGRSDSVFCTKRAEICASRKQTGIWTLGAGNQMTDAISVNQYRSVTIPSDFGRWFYNLMSWFALISSEHPLPHERELFWDGDRRSKEY